MTYNSSSKLFNATLNTSAAGDYNFRIWANDSAGNFDESVDVNVTIEYDYSWTRNPSIFSTVAANASQNPC